METTTKKFWRPIHTKVLLAIAVIAMANTSLRTYVMESLVLNGARIVGINKGVLSNSDSTVPSEQTVYNAIQQMEADTAKPALQGWLDLKAYGAVANGSYSGGFDNRAVFLDVLNRAVNGSVIFVPPGAYYFSDSILWPTSKQVLLVSHGDLYFQPGKSAFVVTQSNRYHKFFLYGKLLGRNQPSTTPDYTNLTSAAVWLKGDVNCIEIHATYIAGFEDAFRLGGDATGTNTANGTQYNKIYFNRLFNNVRGIHISPRGGTTAQAGNYGNASHFFGGQITGRLGVVYTKGNPQLTAAKFNGDAFYNIGFENFQSMKMDTAIKIEYSTGQSFHGIRWEPASIVKHIYIAPDCDGIGFYGCNFIYASWLTTPGNGTIYEGPIYSSSGILFGMRATGYPAVTGSFHNQRVLIDGTKRSPQASTLLATDCPNCDVRYTTSNFETNTGSSATVGVGIETHYANYSSGVATRTLPNATTIPSGTTITIKNLSATQTVTVVGVAAGHQSSIPALAAVTYRSDGNTWYDISNIGSGGSGGSSQWTTSGSNIYYSTGNVGIGVTTPTAAWLHLGGSTASKGIIELPQTSVYQSTPRANSIDYNGTDLRLTASGVPQKILTDWNFATIVNKSWQGNAIWPTYIDGSGAPAGYVLETNGNVNGAAWRENNGGFVKASLITSSGFSVNIATVAIPDNTAGEVEIRLIGYNESGSTVGDMYKKSAVYNYVKKAGTLTQKGAESIISSYTADFTPGGTTPGGNIASNVFTIKVSSPISNATIKWTVYYKVRNTETIL